MADDDKKPSCNNEDRLTLGPDIGGGVHTFVRHHPNHSRSVGLCRRTREGENIAGTNAFVLEEDSERGDCRVHEIDTSSRSGPCKANSAAFTEGWDRIFGGRQEAGVA